MHPWWAILWKAVGFLRWVLRGGIALWVVVLVVELTSPRPDAHRILGILIVGGAALYFFHWGVKGLHRGLTRSGRMAAREAFLRDPTLSQRNSREEIAILLLAHDWERIRLFPWSHRLKALVDLLLQQMFSSQEPRAGCLNGMMGCLLLLEQGRAHWGSTRVGNLEDEEALQFLLVAVALLSALFRLHLLRWGMPAAPFTRKAVARLRGSWLPFCLMEPTPRSFPPALPPEMARAVEESAREREEQTATEFAIWIFRGDQVALPALVHSLLKDPTMG